MKNFGWLIILGVCLAAAWHGEAGDTDEAPMAETERQSLYSAIQGFVGSWWNGSDLYPDPCGWTPIQGVSCDLFDGVWYVTTLNVGPVHENSLVCSANPVFTPHVFKLTHLKSLSFFGCFVSPRQNPVMVPPESWGNLADSLESLEFRSNPGLVGQIPSCFGQLVNLQSLVILENGLSGNVPPNIGSLPNLKRLVLGGNSLTGWIPDSFGGLSKLLILDLSSNSLSGPLTSALGEGKLPMELGKLKNLTLLDMRNNKLSGGLTRSLESMCSLQELILANNPIGGDLRILEWEKLQGLVTLDLSQTGLTGDFPESISKLKNLRFLGLSNNHLGGHISPELATLPSINALYLNGNNFTGELEFSKWFYGKMERRFGAWDNPGLCYRTESLSTSHKPFGVKPCQEQGIVVDKPTSEAKLGGSGVGQNVHFMASLGCSRHGGGYYGFWCPFLLEVAMLLLIVLKSC
ncbi:hypothetical protein EUGRSUZ_G02362 [Eucalyptus grandis]|uniref:Disease resistance R13L4/SHOC-2-like LRR domain-containing protein n=2 Tax=Eucalyptus grandis TaxID=71139 RepID=A0A059BF96_EUCGR|nr:hypothetical protein EUGRSUZ_G02362 [Eucalyptus grandis]